MCREGQYHERLFILLDGQIEQSMTDTTNTPARILVMGPGSFHGELAVLGNQEESYTLTAIRSSIVLEPDQGNGSPPQERIDLPKHDG